jgi:D-tyrosyl-tRNA(Tyr) deacylase
MNPMKIAYFFCIDPEKDRVAPAAFEACRQIHSPDPAGIICDGRPVLGLEDRLGHRFFFIPTDEVVSHDFPRYIPLLNGPLADCDIAGIVNWHEGGNAPDPIFCVHTSGDVPSGIFGPAEPGLTTAVLIAMEEARQEAGLNSWSTRPEATHFSGVAYGLDPSVIRATEVPLIDIEIGSSQASWSNHRAIEALARSLVRVPESIPNGATPFLFVGGVHFEPSLAEAIIGPPSPAFAFGHVLPNQWLIPARYQGAEGVCNLRAAADATRGGIRALVFHEGIKGPIKDAVRGLATELGLPALKHKRLRDGQAALSG